MADHSRMRRMTTGTRDELREKVAEWLYRYWCSARGQDPKGAPGTSFLADADYVIALLASPPEAEEESAKSTAAAHARFLRQQADGVVASGMRYDVAAQYRAVADELERLSAEREAGRTAAELLALRLEDGEHEIERLRAEAGWLRRYFYSARGQDAPGGDYRPNLWLEDADEVIALLSEPAPVSAPSETRNDCGGGCVKPEGHDGPCHAPIQPHESPYPTALPHELRNPDGSRPSAGEPDAWAYRPTVESYRAGGYETVMAYAKRVVGPGSKDMIPVYFGHPAPTEDAPQWRDPAIEALRERDWQRVNGPRAVAEWLAENSRGSAGVGKATAGMRRKVPTEDALRDREQERWAAFMAGYDAVEPRTGGYREVNRRHEAYERWSAARTTEADSE